MVNEPKMRIKIFNLLFCLIILLSQCDDDNHKFKKQTTLPDPEKKTESSVYPDSSNRIFFSGFSWIALDSKLDYDLQHFCESEPMNCLVENSNILKLITSGVGQNKIGVILELDTLLGYGVYSFDLISNTKELKDISEFSFSLLSDEINNEESVTEIGIKFSYDDTTKSPLSYYIYTTIDRVPYEFYHKGKYPTINLTKHLIEIDEGFIRLSSFEGFIDYQTSEIFEYVFEFSKKDFELEVPNRVRVRLSLCLKPEVISDVNSNTNIELLNINFTESATYYSRF